MEKIAPGEAATYYCNGCETEFRVLHEPKAEHDKRHVEGMSAKEVTVCPFCGVGTELDPQD